MLANWLEAVVETPWYDGMPPWPWTVADRKPFSLIRLSGDTTSDEIGSVFGQFQDCSEVECDGLSAQELLSRLAQTEHFGARGGLQVCSHDGLVISPGCCCGLQNWREWQDFITSGKSPFLGHNPWPWLEDCRDVIRVWADSPASTDNSQIVFSRAQFILALDEVHRNLRDFLVVGRAWAETQGALDPIALMDKVDRSFAINYDQPAYMECG